MEFIYEEFKEKFGEEAADLVKSEIESAEDFGLKWKLEINHKNEHWISLLFVTTIDAMSIKVYKHPKKIKSVDRIFRLECEQALKIMAELGA
ncbi:hypothetical protein [Caldifermentibacillus hisashii]|uniref:hypothetical protein n=1 Tax=Caldifermentibacillus hisashii TaxID=996558 RepID=UPI0031010CBD